jgi:hypothetical protein
MTTACLNICSQILGDGTNHSSNAHVTEYVGSLDFCDCSSAKSGRIPRLTDLRRLVRQMRMASERSVPQRHSMPSRSCARQMLRAISDARVIQDQAADFSENRPSPLPSRHLLWLYSVGSVVPEPNRSRSGCRRVMTPTTGAQIRLERAFSQLGKVRLGDPTAHQRFMASCCMHLISACKHLISATSVPVSTTSKAVGVSRGRRMASRDRLARILQRLYSTSSQPRASLMHCSIVGDGCAGSP